MRRSEADNTGLSVISSIVEYEKSTVNYLDSTAFPSDVDLNLQNYLVSRLTASGTHVEGSNDTFGVWREDQFDSQILGLKTAKIDYLGFLPDSIDIITASLERVGIEYATYRTQDVSEICDLLENRGLVEVDDYALLVADEFTPSLLSREIAMRSARPEDIRTLQLNIGTAFIHSRFAKDNLLPPDVTTRVHQKWIENSVNQQAADNVYVALLDGRIVGFISVEEDKKLREIYNAKVGHIPLVGVDPRYQGRGIGKQMTAFVLNQHFKPNGVDKVRIETQAENIGALKAYASCGFKLVSHLRTYRWSPTGKSRTFYQDQESV